MAIPVNQGFSCAMEKWNSSRKPGIEDSDGQREDEKQAGILCSESGKDGDVIRSLLVRREVP